MALQINRFAGIPTCTAEPDIDTKKIQKILLEIKALKDSFPSLKIATRSNYEDILLSNIRDFPEHSIQLKYEKSSWILQHHQLPIPVFEKSSTNLLDAVRTYAMLLENLQPFYSNLFTLDEMCIVGEPQEITTKTTYRVVKWSKRVFMKIEFPNPLASENVSITFHGPTNDVKEMTALYNLKSEDYDDETIYNKILSIFDVPYFPADDEDDIDCSICMSYRCEKNRCPIICCDNSKCDSTFHISCLEKYLKLQKQSVKILSICIGSCPFCKETLSNSYAPFFKRIAAEKKSQE